MDTLSSVFGCDSIRMLDIELIPEKTSTLHTTGCTTFSDDHPQSSFYLDTLQSFEGCDSIVTVYVDGYRLYIPNVFSPNDDQVNDHFEVYAFPSEPGELESFLIFDRFGDLVYSAENWPVKWDGKDKNGSYFNPGVFTYVISYRCEQKMMQQGGTITLVR